jgi:hypothetical protein
MIARYRVLSERLEAELAALGLVVGRAEGAAIRAGQQPQDEGYFIAAAALDLHGFYAGIEGISSLIANELDGGLPSGARWHRDLLEQMTLDITGIRPAVLQADTHKSLVEYLEFRHVVRNVYTFNLQSERVTELVHNLRAAFTLVQRDLQSFIEFLNELSRADDVEGN